MGRAVRRGDVWEVDLGGKAGTRPVLVLTRSGVIPHLTKLVVAEITTQNKGYPTQIAIGTAANLKKTSFVSAEALHSMPRERFKRFLGELPVQLLDRVSDAMTFALDLRHI